MLLEAIWMKLFFLKANKNKLRVLFVIFPKPDVINSKTCFYLSSESRLKIQEHFYSRLNKEWITILRCEVNKDSLIWIHFYYFFFNTNIKTKKISYQETTIKTEFIYSNANRNHWANWILYTHFCMSWTFTCITGENLKVLLFNCRASTCNPNLMNSSREDGEL